MPRLVAFSDLLLGDKRTQVKLRKLASENQERYSYHHEHDGAKTTQRSTSLSQQVAGATYTLPSQPVCRRAALAAKSPSIHTHQSPIRCFR